MSDPTTMATIDAKAAPAAPSRSIVRRPLGRARQLIPILRRADHATRTRVTDELQSAIGNAQLARLVAEPSRRLDRQPATADQTHQEATRAELRRTYRQAEEFERRYKQLQPRLDEARRMAFRADDESLLAKFAELDDKAGTALDTGLALHDLGRDIAELMADSAGVDLAEVSKFTEVLTAVNKGLAAVSLALTLTEQEATTAAEEAARELKVATSGFSALATLASLPAAVSLYADLYLVPLTAVCVVLIGKISEHLHEWNRDWVDLEGEPGYFGAEPGGKPMWEFMLGVMHAGDNVDKMPTIPADVEAYFLHHRDGFGAGAGEQVPVDGWIFKDIDKAKFPDWLARHRQEVWAMLYGSWQVPAASHTPH